MLLHILKKDLKRKRTMNGILFLFITMAAAFLASSVSNLITITGAVERLLDMAKTPDFLTIVASEDGDAQVEEFLKNCEYVTEYGVMDNYVIQDEDIEIIKCAKEPDNHKYDRGNTVLVEPVPENFMKVFNTDGNPLKLNQGEIALPGLQAESNGLQPGDILKLSCGNREMEFTVKAIVNDPVFGSSLMGVKRLFITDEDYRQLTGEGEHTHCLIYSVNCSDRGAFLKEFKKNNFQVISSVEKETVKMCYIFDMLIAGVLMVVSICLILISFLILRFTIVFTLQEDYKEIGIMKAIGIRDISIKGIYLLKYFAIALFGAAAGFLISIPFEDVMLAMAMQNLIVEDAKKNAGVNFICGLAIVGIVLLFCYFSTGKVKKFTAMEAIRNGNSGERYGVKNLIRLHKRKKMNTVFYLACNDVMSNWKRYLVLAAIFCLGTLLILLPLKAVHTLKDKSIIRTFAVQPSPLFLDNGKLEKYLADESNEQLLADMNEIKLELKRNGLNAEVWAETSYLVSCYSENPEENVAYFTMQQTGKEEDEYDVLEGKVPVLPNEVMITEKTAMELSVGIGDSIYYQYQDKDEEFVITGIYQSMMNMGNGFRISKDGKMNSPLSGVFGIQVKVEGDFSDEELKERLQAIFPEYKIETAGEWMDKMIGGISDTLDSLELFILGMVLGINVLITVLTMKTLIARERGEIAMLKSIGLSDHSIKGWQSLRILIVLCFSILTGTYLSAPLAKVTIGPVFTIMGATSIELITKPLEVYVIYPLILLTVTGIAAYLCASEIRKVDLKEINTLE